MKKTILLVACSMFLLAGCAGKYIVHTYPPGAKVYVKDILTKDRKLVGVTPLKINEESKLGEVFFLELEKDNYQPKQVMVKVNAGESLTLNARLDPLNPDKVDATQQIAKNDDKKDQPPGGKPEEKKKELEKEVEDLKLRVAVLENSSSYQKEAIFSARFRGGGPAEFDRDKGDRFVSVMFNTQQAIMKGNYVQAEELVDKAIQMDEYSSQAWVLKGSIAYLKKDFQAARVAWERTLKIDPYNKAAYQYLSQTYKRLGLAELPAKGPETRTPASQLEIEARRKRR